jgi:hypothetical protein
MWICYNQERKKGVVRCENFDRQTDLYHDLGIAFNFSDCIEALDL